MIIAQLIEHYTCVWILCASGLLLCNIGVSIIVENVPSATTHQNILKIISLFLNIESTWFWRKTAEIGRVLFSAIGGSVCVWPFKFNQLWEPTSVAGGIKSAARASHASLRAQVAQHWKKALVHFGIRLTPEGVIDDAGLSAVWRATPGASASRLAGARCAAV